MDLHVYRIEDGESHWYVAETPVEAKHLHLAIYGHENANETTVQRLADDQPLKIYQDEPFCDPTLSITKTCGEWATEKGCIGTTCC